MEKVLTETPPEICGNRDSLQNSNCENSSQKSILDEKQNSSIQSNHEKARKRRLTRSRSESYVEKLKKSKVEKNSSTTTSSGNLNSTKSKEDEAKLMKYKCTHDDCNESFRREKDLDKHEFQHTGVRKYICEHTGCSKRYKLRAHLKRHIQTSHDNQRIKPSKTFKCEIDSCDRKFASKYNVQRHLKEFHGKTKKFTCPDCDRIYERKNHLKSHRITHTKEYPYKCYLCEQGFVSEAIFKRHKCSKHSCEDCNETFKKWSALRQHRQDAHPLSFKCNECDEKFESKQELKTHKNTHKEKLSCTWEGCTKSYFHRRNLKVHINTKHRAQKLKCTFEGCDKELFNKSKLNQHLRLHEKQDKGEILHDAKKTKKHRQKRKDAGIPKKSLVGVLANVVLKRDVEKIFKENIDDIEIEDLSEPETSETDGEEKSCSFQVELEIRSLDRD